MIRFFGKLSCCQRAAKIASVAMLAQAMRQLKESEKTNRERFNELIFFFATKSTTLSPSVATTARRRRDNFQTNRITMASKKSLAYPRLKPHRDCLPRHSRSYELQTYLLCSHFYPSSANSGKITKSCWFLEKFENGGFRFLETMCSILSFVHS